MKTQRFFSTEKSVVPHTFARTYSISCGYTPPITTICLKSSNTIFIKRHQLYVRIHTRTMLSRVLHLTNKAVPKLNNHGLITRGLHWNSKDALSMDKEHIDPRARVNNDAQHTEIVKNQCPRPDCAEKRCPKVCEEPAQASSEGHFTHNKAFKGENKDNAFLSKNDYNGKSKEQHAVLYGKPHKTDPDQVINKNATEFLEKDPNALQNFIQAKNYKDKK